PRKSDAVRCDVRFLDCERLLSSGSNVSGGSILLKILHSRRRAKILKALEPATSSRHEGTLVRRSRLRPSSGGGLGVCLGLIEGRMLVLLKNRITVDFEFFNRIGRKPS